MKTMWRKSGSFQRGLHTIEREPHLRRRIFRDPAGPDIVPQEAGKIHAVVGDHGG
jgi:hypothetical protein